MGMQDTAATQQAEEEKVQATAEAEQCTCGADDAAESDCTAKITEELEAAKKALADAQDECLRARAEVQNMHRRCEQEIEKAKKYAIDRFARDLIPVIEPLEKALEFADRSNEATKNIVTGVEQTFNLLMKALQANHLEVLNPEGAEFDPTFHQAIQSLENPDVPANHVMAVVQKGYTLNGRVIRPAMVIVSKGAGNTVDADA